MEENVKRQKELELKVSSEQALNLKSQSKLKDLESSLD